MNGKFTRGVFIFAAIAWAIPLFAMGIGCLGIVRECSGWYATGMELACLFTVPLWLPAIVAKSKSITTKILRLACLLLMLAVIFVCGGFVYESNILSFPFRVNYYETSDVLMNVVFFIHPFLIGIPATLVLASMVYVDLNVGRSVLPIHGTFVKIIRNLAYAAPLSSLLYFLNIVLPELYVRFFRPDQGSFINGVYAPMYARPLEFINGGENGIYEVVGTYFAGTFLLLWLLNSIFEYLRKKRVNLA